MRTTIFGARPSWILAAGLGLVNCLAVRGAQEPVRLWEEKLVVPTYRIGPPDPNPRFYSGRTYQGAKATFYPYPVLDKLTDERQDKAYQAVYLENQYLKLSVLPELGGRIFSAEDKGNGYNFFYRQHVIKPALIGMLGAWISGGVEWNVPHHHRATSFSPVDYTLESHRDGSQTVWVGEIELRHRMKWLVGLTLHPDRSYIQMDVRFYNRTPVANAFLFWINPAVHAGTNYQVLFPPSTEFAVQHGKPEFSHWPISHQVYGGTDYTRGVDISWWKNHPSPVSFFAWNSPEDFFGGYDHGRAAGVIHVADHYAVPGKKFFEWGNGPEGAMWEKALTDTDGPYLELMAGAYSDNQPDYSWCQPYEVKTWTHFWYPIRQLGGVKNATTEAAVNLVVHSNQTAEVRFNATAEYHGAKVLLTAGDRRLLEQTINISPNQPYAAQVPLPAGVKETDLKVSLCAAGSRELVAYQPQSPKDSPMPAPVKRPAPPAEVKTSEELYLTGLRLEQLYSPAFEPAPYYEEALKRDPTDARANTGLGILLLKRGLYAEAEKKFMAATGKLSRNYLRPKDGEADYYLGVARRAQGKWREAEEAFERAAWNLAWQAASYYSLAELACRSRQFERALEWLDRSLVLNGRNSKALALKAAICRRLGRLEEASHVADHALILDPLDFQAANEQCLVQARQGDDSERTLAALITRMRGEVSSYLELAVDYGNAGLWDDAMAVLGRYVRSRKTPNEISPLIYYYLGYYAKQAGLSEASHHFYQLASRMPPDFCFPFQFEAEPALRDAAKDNPPDWLAPYCLGNLLYDHQPEEAIRAWEQARAMNPQFALVHRNLGLAYAQTQHDTAKAIASLEQAVTLNDQEARLFFELDVLCEAGGVPPRQRLERLVNHHATIAQRDDALTREIVLHIVVGEADQALALLRDRHFHNWEGRGDFHNVYVEACLRQGQQCLARKRYAEARRHFEAALEYPPNLEVGKSRREPARVRIEYLLGTVWAALGEPAKAGEHFRTAAQLRADPGSENQYYQGLALRQLGEEQAAAQRFEALLAAAQQRLRDQPTADYFAKFGERQSERVRQAQGHYLMGLARLGQGKGPEAKSEFARALELDPSHLGANAQSAD